LELQAQDCDGDAILPYIPWINAVLSAVCVIVAEYIFVRLFSVFKYGAFGLLLEVFG
jgi:hypothetical protein